MAGLDYGKVLEPDYDFETIRQSPSTTTAIEHIGRVVHQNWKSSLHPRDAVGKDAEFAERARGIFYDTDMINKRQQETIRICRDCAGALRIDSSSDRGDRILAVHIPRKACDACQQVGHDWYESAERSSFRQICLQDRVKDAYAVRAPV